MCRRKKKYNLRQAHRVVEHLNARQTSEVHVYLCPICPHSYHVGRLRTNQSDYDGSGQTEIVSPEVIL